jgi:hypothetical protein
MLHWSIYLAVFALTFMISFFKDYRFRKSIVLALIPSVALLMSPTLFLVGALVAVGGLALWTDEKSKSYKLDGTLSYTYEFFGDNRFTGYSLTSKGGASSMPISGNETYVPDSFNEAAQRAVSIDPYNWCNGSIVVSTEVEMRGKTPVIYDRIVTYEQLERFSQKRMWDEPKGYSKHNRGIIFHGESPETDKRGYVNLCPPEGLLAEFISQFNGPDLKRIRRK